MPVYTFVCEECSNAFEVDMTPSSYKNEQECAKCGSIDTYRDYSADNIIGIESEPRTLGMLADKNAAKNIDQGTNNPNHYEELRGE